MCPLVLLEKSDSAMKQNLVYLIVLCFSTFVTFITCVLINTLFYWNENPMHRSVIYAIQNPIRFLK